MKKYEFTGETKTIEINDKQIELKRIRAIRDFGDVKAGGVGGWIESEKNLSHDGECWVYDNAEVYGNAKVYGNAWVWGSSKVYDNEWTYIDGLVAGE